MSPAELRRSVLAGKPVAGAMIFEFFSPGVPQILVHAGCAFVIYDMEHTAIGLETIKSQVGYCRGLDIVPMARVVRGEYRDLAAVLDAGAKGVMIPMVESAAQAKAIAEATHYPPVGRRGAAFGFAHDDYAPGTPSEKMEAAHAQTLVIAQIETERGLEAVDEIAEVDGIDVLWVGHFDLTNFLGVPGEFDHPKYLAAIEKVVAAGRKHGKGLGFMATDGDWATDYRRRGFNMIAAGTDIGALMSGVRGTLSAMEG